MKSKIKRYIKKEIRKKLADSVSLSVSNNNIKVVASDSVLKENSYIEFEGKKYAFENCVALIPYSKDNLKRMLDNKFKIGSVFYGKVIDQKIKKSEITLLGEEVVIEDKEYLYQQDQVLEFEELLFGEDSVEIKVNDIFVESEDQKTLFILDENYGLLNKVEGIDNRFVISGLNELLEDNEIQLVFACDNKAFFATYNNTEISSEHYKVRFERGRIFLCEIMRGNYKFEVNNGLADLPILKARYKNIDKVRFDTIKKELIVFSKEKKYHTFNLYLKSMKTREKELVYTSEKQSEYHIGNLDGLLNRKISCIDRYLLEYEILDEKAKKIERNYLKIGLAKKRGIEEHVLFEANANHIAFLDENYLVIENKDNHFCYEEKYDFDFKSASFATDYEVVDYENDELTLKFKVNSLLTPMAKIVLYVADSYKKKKYLLYEQYMNEVALKIEDIVKIDMRKLSEKYYYNMRLNFRIGVIYENGYSEDCLLVRKRQDYSVEDRYLYKKELEDGMIVSFYMGDKQFNLNLFYTSKEEYEKNVSFQIGREKYFQTLYHEEVDENLIFFEANLGKNYTGNPKYLYEYMYNNPAYNNYKFVWAYPDVNSDKIPGNPVLVKRGSSEYFYYLAKAKYWINNIIFPIKEKRAETIYLNTWHGTPLKKLGFDIECEGPEKQAFGNLYSESQNWDYLLADNDYGEEKLVGAFRFKKNLIKKGYPINDIFYDNQRKTRVKDRLYSEYPMINGKKVILYAPTWRDLKGDYVRGYEFELPFDMEKLYQNISDEYVVLVKLHHLIANNLVIDERYKDFLINVSDEEDVMELLCVTDILITDYSSVFYDFASARKPILFYMYDLEEYLNETRGLYVGIESLPGPIIRDSETLVSEIMSIKKNEYAYTEKLNAFCDDMAKYCDGNSCKNVLDIVIEKEQKHD